MRPQKTTVNRKTWIIPGPGATFEGDPPPKVILEMGFKIVALLRRMAASMALTQRVREMACLWWAWLRTLLGGLCDEAYERWRVGRYSLWTGLAPPQKPQTIPRK